MFTTQQAKAIVCNDADSDNPLRRKSAKPAIQKLPVTGNAIAMTALRTHIVIARQWAQENKKTTEDGGFALSAPVEILLCNNTPPKSKKTHNPTGIVNLTTLENNTRISILYFEDFSFIALRSQGNDLTPSTEVSFLPAAFKLPNPGILKDKLNWNWKHTKKREGKHTLLTDLTLTHPKAPNDWLANMRTDQLLETTCNELETWWDLFPETPMMAYRQRQWWLAPQHVHTGMPQHPAAPEKRKRFEDLFDALLTLSLNRVQGLWGEALVKVEARTFQRNSTLNIECQVSQPGSQTRNTQLETALQRALKHLLTECVEAWDNDAFWTGTNMRHTNKDGTRTEIIPQTLFAKHHNEAPSAHAVLRARRDLASFLPDANDLVNTCIGKAFAGMKP